MPTVTNTGTIQSIAPLGNGKYKIILEPGSYDITTINAAAQVFAFGTLNTSSVLLDPYINTPNLTYSDYNAILGNATDIRPGTLYQDLDYSLNAVTPVNFDQIISGSATKANIPDSNYSTKRITLPRYEGCKNGSASDFNALTGSVDQEDAIIADFNWGGGTYPEISDGGGLQLNKLLLTGATRDDVTTITAEQRGFTGSLKNAFPQGSIPVFKQYTTTSTKTVNAQVLDYGWSVPAISNYYISSGSTGTTGEALVQSITADKLRITSASLVDTNSSGYEIPSSTKVDYTQIISTIDSSLSQGDRWFVTFYSNLAQTASGVLTPVNVSYTSGLSKHGVFEILSSSGNILTLNKEVSFSGNGLALGTYNPIGLEPAGCLIWKAVQNNQFILFEGNTLSGVGKGALITSTPSTVIKEDFDYITKTYGQNPINN